jgi:hypothetical protein
MAVHLQNTESKLAKYNYPTQKISGRDEVNKKLVRRLSFNDHDLNHDMVITY